MQGVRRPTSARTKGKQAQEANVDDLLEENISLKYQVQKLQQVLNNGARGILGGEATEEERFRNQIRKLQVFMNDHSTQKLALKSKLSDAKKYVNSLEEDKERRVRASSARAAGRDASKPRKRTVKTKSSTESPVVQRMRSALGPSPRDARVPIVTGRPRSVDPGPSRSLSERKASGGLTTSSGPSSPRKRTGKKKPGKTSAEKMAATGNSFGVTTKDLEYIFDEVVNLKHKLAQAERKLQRGEEDQQSPSQISDPDLRQEMQTVKATQEKLVRQINAQQDVLSDIFHKLKLSGLAPNSIAGDSLEPLDLYRTRYPAISVKTTTRKKNGIRHPVVRRGGQAKQRTDKFALLSRGYSTAHVDDPKYVERALAVDKHCAYFE